MKYVNVVGIHSEIPYLFLMQRTDPQGTEPIPDRRSDESLF